MKAIFIILVTILLAFSSCKDSTINIIDNFGEDPFVQHKIEVTAEPPAAVNDTTISLKATVYPKFIGTGQMSIYLDVTPESWVLLEYPYYDTLKVSRRIWAYPKFETIEPYTQEWKFRLLRTFSESYILSVSAAYDSVFIAENSKMYAIGSSELNKFKVINNGSMARSFILRKP